MIKKIFFLFRQLGYTYGIATEDSFFGIVGEVFAMDDVDCDGTELNIRDCTHETEDDCDSDEAAGVMCFNVNPSMVAESNRAGDRKTNADKAAGN